MKKFAVIILALISVVAWCSILKQNIALEKGWNAIYFEVTPENNNILEVFGETTVSRVGCYMQDSYSKTTQYSSDGTKINGMPVVFASWDRDCQEAATLSQISGGEVYLVYATNACTFAVMGTPVLPYFVWRDTSKADVMMNLVGVSVDEGVEVSPRDYFGAGPYTQAGSSYTICGSSTAVPLFMKLGTKGVLKNGAAIAASGTREGEWSGEIKVSVPVMGKVVFNDSFLKGVITIENKSLTNRIVRVTHRKSDSQNQVMPRLNYLKMGNSVLDGTSWENLDEGDFVEKELKPNEAWKLILSVDRTTMTDKQKSYASLLRVEAIDSPSKMRVFVPVVAEHEILEEGEGAFPQGLWVGEMDLQQVNRSDAKNQMTAEPEKAGGNVKATLILHVDKDNKVSMLQRVAIGVEKQEDGSNLSRLYQELSDIPEGVVARRISSVLIDTAFPKLEGLTVDGKMSIFGETAFFEFTVDENSKVNPYRHAWHPDHDGLSATYMDRLPTGDNLENYKYSVKPELFSITNKISLHWQDIEGNAIHEWNPEEVSFGRIDWKISGLRSSGDIFVRGTFVIKRVSSINVIE